MTLDIDTEFAESLALAARISALAEGLSFSGLGSEGDEPLRSVWLSPQDPAGGLVVAAVAHGAGAEAEVAGVRRTTAGAPLLLSLVEGYLGTAAHPRAEALRAVLVQEVTALLAVVLTDTVGRGEHPVYIVGRAADGAIVGIRSMVVWT